MEYQKIHTIDKEMYDTLMSMVLSEDEDNINMVEEIILNSNTDDISSYGYIQDICLSIIIRHYDSSLKSYYLKLRKHPNWKIFQEECL